MAPAVDAVSDGDSHVTGILDTYIYKEPFGRFPFGKEQESADVDSRLAALQTSLDYFSKLARSRTVERILFEMARVNVFYGRWSAALDVLLPLWREASWRRSGWFVLLEELDWLLRECARHAGDRPTLVGVEWELLCHYLEPRSDQAYDFANCLADVEALGSKPQIITSSKNSLSCTVGVSATFAFTVANGHVGETLPFQVVLTSRAHRSSKAITLSYLRLAFEGGMRNVEIQHDPHIDSQTASLDGLVHFYTPSLQKMNSDCLQGSSDLILFPASSKVFSLVALPFDSGRIEVSKISLCVQGDDFNFEFILPGDDFPHQNSAWALNGKYLSKSETRSERSTSIEVLPKPPKVRIELPNLFKTYFTGEQISLNIQVSNEEDEESSVDIEINFYDQGISSPLLRWGTVEEVTDLAVDENTKGTLKTSLGPMASSETRLLTFNFHSGVKPAEHTLEIIAHYSLLSDPDTPVSKAVSIDMLIVRPFEANFDFAPQIHEKQWPSFFHVDEEKKIPDTVVKAVGLCQRWTVNAAIASFASTDLVLEAMDLQLATTPENVVCTVWPSYDNGSSTATLPPQAIQERRFGMDLQKASFEDCRTTCFDLQLRVLWRRDTAGAPTAIAHLQLPELVIPYGEPRVLAAATSERGKVHVDYMIENPSMHVLSFSVTMDASENFAFSGPKATSLQLVPYSHRTIRYTLLPFVHGRWVEPQLKIIDEHWHKILKVNATGDMKGSQRGILIWIDAEE